MASLDTTYVRDVTEREDVREAVDTKRLAHADEAALAERVRRIVCKQLRVRALASAVEEEVGFDLLASLRLDDVSCGLLLVVLHLIQYVIRR